MTAFEQCLGHNNIFVVIKLKFVFFYFTDSIIEVTQIRNATPPTEIVDENSDDDDVIFVGCTSPAAIDLCTSDEISDVQVVNFLLDHTQPPSNRFERTTSRRERDLSLVVQLMAQTIEESATTSAVLAAAKEAAEQANKAAAAKAAEDATPPKRQRVENNPTKQISCAVCLEQPFDNRPSATICGHVFCEHCIKMAIKQCKKCPMCNRKLNLKQVHPLYI